MSKNPNRKLFAFLPIILFLWGGLVPIHAVLLADSVTSSRTLQQVANTIQSSTDTGVFQISFSTYKNINQFKLDAPTARIDSLIFQRTPKQESDSAINVDATLFDIKATKGTVVLRGLAFNLTKPKSVLIAGSELGKENLHLVIDSCFIYADTLDGVFLSWAAGNAGTIEIRHSFFVSKTGTVLTKLSLSGGKVVLQNNLFNFPGVLAPTVALNADIKSNTFNRTQLSLLGDLSFGIPTFNFSRNFIAHHGNASAIGSPNYWFGSFSGMANSEATILNNRIYNTWKGFNLLDNVPFTNNITNQFLDTLPGKRSTELWDWYTTIDSIAGFSSGTSARKIAYNVFPDSITFPWTGPSLTGKVFFKSALFPRQMAPSTNSKPILSNLTILANPTLRFFQPAAGPVHFGPFQVDSISVAVKPSSGHPVLLASDSSTGVYKPQPPHSYDSNVPVSMFTNTLASARYFFLSFLGNTARGINITPTTTGKDDSLVFEKVDSAGYTTVGLNGYCTMCTNDLRYLKRNIRFRTTATLKDSLTFGLKDTLPPFRSESLFWMLEKPFHLIKAQKTSGPNRKVYAKILADSSFDAFLVEKLSVPKGGVTFTVPDGTVRAEADSGYQITLDSLAAIDKIHYGQSTHAYGYSAQGRLPGDSVTLHLKWKPDQEAFQDSLGTIKPLSLVPDTAGFVKIALKPSDTGKTYFLAVKYNILADSLYNGPIEGGVILTNFTSSTAAKSKFVDLSSTIQNNTWKYHDTAFKSSRFLAGKEFKTNGANPKQPWDMTFTVNGATHRDSVEAWWSDGKAWTQIISPKPVFLTGSSSNFQVKNIPDSARYIVAVERLPPPETYVSDTVSWANNILHVTVAYKGDSLNKSIDQYCVELKSIDQNGQTVVPACDPKPIGTPADIKLNANTAYIYLIQYFSKGVRYGIPSYQTLEGPSWDRSIVLPPALSLQPKNFWHLVGFPFAGTLAKSIVKDETIPIAKDILDTIVVMHIENANGKQKVETLKGWNEVGFNSGDAFLMGGTQAFNLKMNPEAKFLPLGVVRMPLDSGWHFLANPFPTTLKTNKIRSVKWGAARFWKLVPPATDSSQPYRWDTTGSLKAFSGYAYHTRTNDTLIFDLFADSVPPNPLPKISSWPTLIKVAVLMPTTSSQMYLTTQSSEQSIPYFPAPGAGVELRLGGGQGFLLKAIPNLQAMDEPLTIRAMQDGYAAFSVGLSAELLYAANVRIRLIDLGTGKVYAEPELADLPLFKGSHNYRLLMGTAAFVEERVTGFLNEIPQSIGLSQNYPNPTRGVTRFLFAWPAIQSQERHAVLQILDTRGRELHKVPLEHIQVGRQELTLDFKNWKPGIYLYRLTVFGDGRTTHLQKRMLIAP